MPRTRAITSHLTRGALRSTDCATAGMASIDIHPYHRTHGAGQRQQRCLNGHGSFSGSADSLMWTTRASTNTRRRQTWQSAACESQLGDPPSPFLLWTRPSNEQATIAIRGFSSVFLEGFLLQLDPLASDLGCSEATRTHGWAWCDGDALSPSSGCFAYGTCRRLLIQSLAGSLRRNRGHCGRPLHRNRSTRSGGADIGALRDRKQDQPMDTNLDA